jgi:hypothetical protein
MLASSTRKRKLMARLNTMASVFVISGYLFFIGVIGYVANVTPTPGENPKVPSSYFTIQMTAIQRIQIIKDPMTIVPPTASTLSACSAVFMREKFLRALLILFIMCFVL